MDSTVSVENVGIQPNQLTAPDAMPERVAEIDWLIRVLKAHGIDQMNMVAIITSYIDASVPQRTFDP